MHGRRHYAEAMRRHAIFQAFTSARRRLDAAISKGFRPLFRHFLPLIFALTFEKLAIKLAISIIVTFSIPMPRLYRHYDESGSRRISTRFWHAARGSISL